MADFILQSGVSTAPKHKRAKNQNFQLTKEGSYVMLIGSIRYEVYKPHEITQEVLDLRDARRLKQGMRKAQY